jgi:hypothetical protein
LVQVELEFLAVALLMELLAVIQYFQPLLLLAVVTAHLLQTPVVQVVLAVELVTIQRVVQVILHLLRQLKEKMVALQAQVLPVIAPAVVAAVLVVMVLRVQIQQPVMAAQVHQTQSQAQHYFMQLVVAVAAQVLQESELVVQVLAATAATMEVLQLLEL